MMVGARLLIVCGLSSNAAVLMSRIVVGTYHARRNIFERFREFLELISRFEFEFCRRGNYIF